MSDEEHEDTLRLLHGKKINPAQWITIAVAVCTFLGTVGTVVLFGFNIVRDVQELKVTSGTHTSEISTIRERVDANKQTATEAKKTGDELAEKVSKMDANGTQASQKGIYEESAFSKQTAATVATLTLANAETQKTLMEIMGTVKETKANVDWLIRQQTSDKVPPRGRP